MMKESNLKEGMEQCINLLTLRLLPFWVSFEFFSFLFLAEWLSFYSIGLFPTHLYLLFCCQILPCVPNDDGSGCLPPPPQSAFSSYRSKPDSSIGRPNVHALHTYTHTTLRCEAPSRSTCFPDRETRSRKAYVRTRPGDQGAGFLLMCFYVLVHPLPGGGYGNEGKQMY